MFNTDFFFSSPVTQVPFDDRRLLFPPVPAAVLISAAYAIYLMLFPNWMAPLVLAGMIAGELNNKRMSHTCYIGPYLGRTTGGGGG